MAGSQRQCLLVLPGRFNVFFLREINIPQLVVSVDVVRVQRERVMHMPDRFLKLSAQKKHLGLLQRIQAGETGMFGGGLGPGRDRKSANDRSQEAKNFNAVRESFGGRHNGNLNEMLNVSRSFQ